MTFGQYATELTPQQEAGIGDRVAHLDVIFQRHLRDRLGVRAAAAFEFRECPGDIVAMRVEQVGQFDRVLEAAVHASSAEDGGALISSSPSGTSGAFHATEASRTGVLSSSMKSCRQSCHLTGPSASRFTISSRR